MLVVLIHTHLQCPDLVRRSRVHTMRSFGRAIRAGARHPGHAIRSTRLTTHERA
jgi:hypothetical protein